MENIRRFAQLTKDVISSFTDPENKGFAAISGFGGIFMSWHIATFDVGPLLIKYALPIKIVGAFFTVVIAPPLSCFMKDIYYKKIQPNIKFLNKK